MGQTADKLALWLMDRIRDMVMTELGPIRTQLTNHHARFGDIEREMLTTDDQRAMSHRVSKLEELVHKIDTVDIEGRANTREAIADVERRFDLFLESVTQ